MENLLSVLCDPDGRVSIHGSQADIEIVQAEIESLRQQLATKDAEIKRRVTLDEMNAEVDGMEKAVADHYEKQLAAALEALIAKSGEVMRERCNNAFGEKYGWYADATFNAIPGVKLEDLS